MTRSDEEQYDQEEYEEDSEDDDWWDDVPINKGQRNITVNKLNVSNKQKTSLQPQDKQFGKYVNKIKLDKYEGKVLVFLYYFIEQYPKMYFLTLKLTFFLPHAKQHRHKING